MAAVVIKQTLKTIPLVNWANSIWKARAQEKRAAAGQAFYLRQANRSRIECFGQTQLSTLLRERTSARNQGRWPKQKGQLHLFLACGIYNWEAVLPKSLAPFGQVTLFDWRALGFEEKAPHWLERRVEMNAQMLAAFHQANQQSPVDAVVGYLSGHNTSPDTLRAMAATGACIFNFCLDDKLRFPGRMLGGRYTSPAGIASAVDLNLTNARESIVKYAVHGGLAIFWPEAGHPEIHRPYDLPFDFDVSFVGGCYGWRPKFIQQLHKHGIQVECFGQGWPNGPLRNEEVIRLFSRSRINLGFGGVGYSKRLLCLKGRDFEVPMSGGLYLTQHNPELAEVFALGKEIVTYRDARDCAETIKQLLAEPARAQAIRQAGRTRCLRDHTYERRWTEIFTLAGLLADIEAKA